MYTKTKATEYQWLLVFAAVALYKIRYRVKFSKKSFHTYLYYGPQRKKLIVITKIIEKKFIALTDFSSKTLIGTNVSSMMADLIVVTHNIKHFNRIEGIEHEDWSI